MPTIEVARKQLLALSKLQEDLSPCDPMRFSERHFSHARYLISILPREPKIYPNYGKSILFTYGDSDDYLEFELFEDATIGMFYKTSKDNYTYQKTTIYQLANFFKYFFPEEMKNECSAG